MAKNVTENDISTVKATGKKEVVASLKADTEGHFEDLADQSKKNLAKGGKNVQIDLIKTVAARFTKSIGYIKEGHEQMLSQTAFDIYKKKDAVELI